MISYGKKSLTSFVDHWLKQDGYEKGETHQFWLQLLRDLGYPQVDDVLFEYHLPSGGFIDVWIRDANVLVEQKSLGIDLDKPELRQGKLKTPLEQALDYVDEMPRLEQPRFVIVCNFQTFRVYDRDKWSKSQLAQNAFEFTLDELGEHPEYLGFIIDPKNSRLDKEKKVSIQAGELIGKLYDMLRKGYQDPDSPDAMHALNVLCVRLVFCLYCEDAGLFEKDAFYHYLRPIPASFAAVALKRLFKALDTELKDREHADADLKHFPYVNGGLFRDDVEVPIFDAPTLEFLLEEASLPVDWSYISPTIFGGIFESTLNPETRRSGGMHYTSPENIHKVIDPLFLDDLKAEFAKIRDEAGVTPNKRKFLLTQFHKKLCSLKFFDPACGSGNFLTETYLCLRKLEDAVLRELWRGQTNMGLHNQEEAGDRVNLGQFYGIEINDFAVTVAETALWISRLKANCENPMFFEMGGDDFPLHESAHIVHGNALRIDWNDVLPAEECSFIMGNPPFVGFVNHSKEQEADRTSIFGNIRTVDYVACWYWKSAEYIANVPVRVAFVSTNSICQGQQVQAIWKSLFNQGFHIDFAWTTFIWGNEATDQAHVHVVVVGFSKQNSSKRSLYRDGEVIYPDNINAYLAPSPNIFIDKHAMPLCDVPPMVRGCQPNDDGNFLMNTNEKNILISSEPLAEKWIRPFSMGAEFIKGQERWCLWLEGITPEELQAMPLVKARVDAVRESRLASSSAMTRKKADTPWLFDQIRYPSEIYIAIPKVSSERRKYIPMGYVTNGTVPGDKLFFISSESRYVFGVIMSQFHNAWMRVVSGRLKSDYSYSNTIVYNNFIWPDPTPEQRSAIESCAQLVLDTRANHPGKSLAELYDPDKMPFDLLAAHKALDAAVERAYGVDFQGDEEKIVAHLFKLYAERTSAE